jgi:threonine dehydratase
LRHSEWLSELTHADVFLKLETLQPTFSFKVRGALNAVLHMVERGVPRATPLVTASAGNHGRALAWAARAAGFSLTVYVPEGAPRSKLDAIGRSGAELKTCADYDEAERRAQQHGARGDAVFVSPYSDPDVIAGAGTIALEILDDRPEIDMIIVPVGGGGLVAGVAIAARGRSAGRTRVTGVEVEASCPFTRSLQAGQVVPIEVKPTLADGLAGNLDPETITFEIVRELVDDVALASELDLQRGIAGLALEERLICEGAGATGVAALLAGKLESRGKRVAIVLSGANIDMEKFADVISRTTR